MGLDGHLKVNVGHFGSTLGQIKVLFNDSKVNFSEIWLTFGQIGAIFDHSDVDVGHFWDWVVI